MLSLLWLQQIILEKQITQSARRVQIHVDIIRCFKLCSVNALITSIHYDSLGNLTGSTMNASCL